MEVMLIQDERRELECLRDHHERQWREVQAWKREVEKKMQEREAEMKEREETIKEIEI
jgi:hypothetical protein